MRPPRSSTYQIGRYIVRRDAAGPTWRVFLGGIEVLATESLVKAYNFAKGSV